MKVTFINRMMGIHRGGGEHFDLNLAKGLINLNCEVSFITGRGLLRIEQPLEEFHTTYVRSPYLRWLDYRYSSNPLKPLRSLGSRSRTLDRWMFENMSFRELTNNKGFDSDVIQTCGMPRLASFINSRLEIPTVIHWPGPPSSWADKWFGSYSANIANGAALDKVRQLDPSSLDVPPGVDSHSFKPGKSSKIRSKYNIAESSTVLLFVGRLITIKNLKFLVSGFSKAIDRESDMYLILVGSGEQENDIANHVNKLGLSDRVFFAGNQPNEVVADFYRAADIFTLTSHYENLPNVIFEAMSSGLPVVATNVGGIHYQIKHGLNGFLVDPSSKKEFTESIVCLAKNPRLRSKMGQENRKYVESTFNWESSAAKLLDLYEKIIPPL